MLLTVNSVRASCTISILAAIPDYLLRPQYQTRDQKRISNMESQIDELTKLMKELQVQNTSIKRMLNDNLSMLHDSGAWHPMIETKVDALNTSVRTLQSKVDELASRPPPSGSGERVFDFEEINLMKLAAADQAATSAWATSRPLGHGDATNHRGMDSGASTTLVTAPVIGAP